MISSTSARPTVAGLGYKENTALAPTIRAEAAPPVKRLVVLVPDAEVSESRLAGKLAAIAPGRNLNVLLLGQVRDIFREPRARRRLATLASLTRSHTIQVETRLIIATRWKPMVQSVWHEGDLLVCHTEQSQPVFGIGREPLAPALASNLNIPVYALAGFYPKLPQDWPEWVNNLLGILPFITILAGCTLLQVGIQRTTTGAAQTGLLCLSVIVEYGLVAAWDAFLVRQTRP